MRAAARSCEMNAMSTCSSIVMPMPTPMPLTAAIDRLAERGERVEEVREARARRRRSRSAALALEAPHLAEVLARGERASGAGDHDARDVVARFGFLQRRARECGTARR